MNQELMKEFKADLKEFREMTEKFYAKEVSVRANLIKNANGDRASNKQGRSQY